MVVALEGVNLALLMKAMCVRAGRCQPRTIRENYEQMVLEDIKPRTAAESH